MIIYYFSLQERKRWSTRPGNGTRNVSAASCARRPSVPRASYPGNRRSTAPLATRRSSRHAALSAARYVNIV